MGLRRLHRGVPPREGALAPGLRLKSRLRRLAVERLGVPRGANVRPYALPGVARAAELRWRWTLRRRPVMELDEYARTAEVGEIEELLACLLCGERRVQPLFAPSRPGRWSYRVVRCPACGLMYRNPGVRPERLGDLYDSGGYAKFLTGRYARKRRDSYRLTMDAFGTLLADGAGRRLLDYGCGAGLFLDLARERGFDAYGVDLAPDSVEEARRRGHKAWLGSPLDVPEVAAGGFDVVTLWSVLAHLPRPVEDLAMLRGLLAPGGVLVISTVNANSLLLKTYREGWGGFTPNHLVFSSPTTLPRLLEAAGFGKVELRPMYGEIVERGEAGLSPRQERRLRASVLRGNQGSMLRAAAFNVSAPAAAPAATASARRGGP